MKVRCIDNKGVLLTLGREYEVVSESTRELWTGVQTFWHVSSDKGNVHGYWKSRFEVVETTHADELLAAFQGAS